MGRDQHSSGGTELGRFLRDRRTRVTPAEAGLRAGAGLRRTPGLRREELATLAGISIDYYARLERGTETRPSPPVIDALSRVLRLGEDEQAHLRELAARADRPVPPAAPSHIVPEGLDLILESLRPNPAIVVARSFTVLAANPGGLGLYAGIEEWPPAQRNLGRYVFLHPAARDVLGEWEIQARNVTAWLRGLAGVEPDAPDLSGLIGDLRRESAEFARLWERYDVRGDTRGQVTFRHPAAGEFTLGFQGMTVDGSKGQHLVVYYAEPGTPAYDAMVLLDATAPSPAPGEQRTKAR